MKELQACVVDGARFADRSQLVSPPLVTACEQEAISRLKAPSCLCAGILDSKEEAGR